MSSLFLLPNSLLGHGPRLEGFLPLHCCACPGVPVLPYDSVSCRMGADLGSRFVALALPRVSVYPYCRTIPSGVVWARTSVRGLLPLCYCACPGFPVLPYDTVLLKVVTCLVSSLCSLLSPISSVLCLRSQLGPSRPILSKCAYRFVSSPALSCWAGQGGRGWEFRRCAHGYAGFDPKWQRRSIFSGTSFLKLEDPQLVVKPLTSCSTFLFHT